MNNTLKGKLNDIGSIQGNVGNGSVGTANYNNLKNKPKINEFELEGNASFTDLGINALTNSEIEDLLK